MATLNVETPSWASTAKAASRGLVRAAALLFGWLGVSFLTVLLIKTRQTYVAWLTTRMLIGLLVAGLPVALVLEKLANARGATADGVPLPRTAAFQWHRPARDTVAGRRMRDLSWFCAGLPVAIAVGLFLAVLMST